MLNKNADIGKFSKLFIAIVVDPIKLKFCMRIEVKMFSLCADLQGNLIDQ